MSIIQNKSLPSTLCQNIEKEKSLISSCFRCNPNVCMIENCIGINMFKPTKITENNG